MSYFCPTCKRKHRPSSAIYKKHLKRKKAKKSNVPCDKVLPCNLKRLSITARMQIDVHLNKIHLDKKYNYGKWREVYIREINKVILDETQDSFLLK